MTIQSWAFHLPKIVETLKARHRAGARFLNAALAVEHLREQLGALTLLKLYEKFFPAAYRKSKAATRRAHPDGYSPKEIEFFKLVSRKLFPIVEFWDMWEDEEMERSFSIPLETEALETNMMSEWVPFWKIVFTLANPEVVASWMGELNWNELETHLPPGADLPLCVTYGGAMRVNYPAFFKAAAAWTPRLRDLVLAFKYAAQSTENVFLDTDYEMLGYSEMPNWCVENLEWLANEWQAAESLLKRIGSVRTWLEAKPASLARLIALWNQHAAPAPQHPRHHNHTQREETIHDEENEDDNPDPGE